MLSANDYKTTAEFIGDGVLSREQSLRFTFQHIDAALRFCLYSRPRPEECLSTINIFHLEDVLDKLRRFGYKVERRDCDIVGATTIAINLKEFLI